MRVRRTSSEYSACYEAAVCEDIRSRYFSYPLPPKDADFRPQQELQATGVGTQGARFPTYQSLLSTGNVTLRPS